jgi:hypothetical protein
MGLILNLNQYLKNSESQSFGKLLRKSKSDVPTKLFIGSFREILMYQEVLSCNWFLSINNSSGEFLAWLIKLLFENVGKLFRNQLGEIFPDMVRIIWIISKKRI